MEVIVTSLADNHWGSVAGVLCDVIEDTEGRGKFVRFVQI